MINSKGTVTVMNDFSSGSFQASFVPGSSPSSVSSFLLSLKATQPLPSCAAPSFFLVDMDAVDMDMVDMDITHNIYMSPILISHIQFADLCSPIWSSFRTKFLLGHTPINWWCSEYISSSLIGGSKYKLDKTYAHQTPIPNLRWMSLSLSVW